MNEQLINEAAVAAALVFKDTGLTVLELEQIAAAVQETLKEHFRKTTVPSGGWTDM